MPGSRSLADDDCLAPSSGVTSPDTERLMDSDGAAAHAAQAREEQEWVARCRQGEIEAFSFLVVRYERMMRSVIRRMLARDEDVDDMAQASFVTAFERLAQYSGQSRFSTWLCQIAVNKCRDLYRSRRDAGGWRDGGDAPDPVDDALGPEQRYEARQKDAVLQAALGRLKPQDRELIVMKYIAGHDYETVARILGCSPQAAKVRSVRARTTLRAILSGMGVEP